MPTTRRVATPLVKNSNYVRSKPVPGLPYGKKSTYRRPRNPVFPSYGSSRRRAPGIGAYIYHHGGVRHINRIGKLYPRVPPSYKRPRR